MRRDDQVFLDGDLDDDEGWDNREIIEFHIGGFHRGNTGLLAMREAVGADRSTFKLRELIRIDNT